MPIFLQGANQYRREESAVRVFHLVKGLGRGGAETLLVRTAEPSSGSSGRNGYGYFLPWKDALVPELKAQGCRVRCFPARNPLEMVLQVPALFNFLRSWRPDLIHCHLPLAGVIGRLVGRILGVPVVYTEHNLQERYHPLTRVANRFTWNMQSHVISVSDEVRDSIANSLPGATPVSTILNGVECETFTPEPQLRRSVRDDLGLDDSDFLVGTVAVFRKQKRLDLWLEVAKGLADRFSNVKFLLVGDGPERPLVERLIADYGLEDRVFLPGLRQDVIGYFCAMDIFFMSSDFEGLPVALLEAMACGTPAVATRAGGIGEVIQDSSQGLLSGTGEVSELLEHLTTLLSDSALRTRIGVAGRARVQEAFSLRRMRLEIERVYQEVTGCNPASAAAESLPGYLIDDEPLEEEMLNLMRASLGEGSTRSPRTLAFFRWKHLENEAGRSYVLAVRDTADRSLAGLRLFQKWSLERGGESYSAVRAVDTCTHPGHQRRGIFTFLTRKALGELAADGTDLVFNTPNRSSLPGYLKMGWELVEKIPVRLRWPLPRGSGKSASRPQGFEDLLRSHSADELGRLIEQCQVSERLKIRKSVSYLRWRYFGHPTVKYFFEALSGDQGVESLLVWCETSRFRFKELVVCELFARSVESAGRILNSVLLQSDSHYAVSAFHNDPVAEEAVKHLGFRDLGVKKIELTVYPLSERGRLAVDPAQWSFSAGDLQVF